MRILCVWLCLFCWGLQLQLILLLPRPSLEALLEEYWDLMPEYQGVKLESLEVLRILFGFFPTYRQAQNTTISTHDQPL